MIGERAVCNSSKVRWSTLWILIGALSPGTAQTGAIKGVVEDKVGTAIRQARVVLTPPGSPGELQRHVIADDEGKFEYKQVTPGKYFIYATKEEDGFPDVVFAFLDIGQPPPKEIDYDGADLELRINVGEPEGKLSCVVEDTAGRPVPSAGFRLSAASNPELNLTSGARKDGTIESLVPGVPIIVEVGAPGFQTWRSGTITVKTGEVKRLRVTLTPARASK